VCGCVCVCVTVPVTVTVLCVDVCVYVCVCVQQLGSGLRGASCAAPCGAVRKTGGWLWGWLPCLWGW